MARPARKSERGLTLVETVIALAIVFIVFMGLMETGVLVLDYNITNTMRDEGVKVGEMELATVRETPFATLDGLAGTGPQPSPNGIASREIRGLSRDYTPTWTVTRLAAGTLQVLVDVTWQRNAWRPSGPAQQRNYSHQLVTLVRQR